MMHTEIRRPRAAHIALLAVSALLFCALLLIPAAFRPAEAVTQLTDATVKKYEEQLKVIAAEKAEISKKLVTARQNKSDALELKSYLDRQMNLTLEQIDTLNALIEETADKIGKKQLEIIDKKADVDHQRENFLTRLRITYEEGDASYLELLLGADSLYDFLTRVERIGYMMDYNINLMEKDQQAALDLQAEEEQLEAYQVENEKVKAQLADTEAELAQQRSETEAYLSTLEKTISANSASYAATVEREAQVNAEMEAYIKELQAKANAAYVGGEFIWPVDIKWARISSYFGWRTLYGVKDYHRGIDIPAYSGENIYASNAGTVIKAEYHWSYGNYVIIDHGGGKSTLYAHSSKLLCKVGDKVKQGQVIAKVGTTGNSSGNHLHFEVRIDGVCQNPIEGYVVQPK